MDGDLTAGSLPSRLGAELLFQLPHLGLGLGVAQLEGLAVVFEGLHTVGYVHADPLLVALAQDKASLGMGIGRASCREKV